MSRLKTLSDLRRRRMVLALRNAGPVGAPGMPEWGGLPIRKKLPALGVRDRVRISDARMSGTHYGTCILHICPESAVGGPTGCVRSGGRVHLHAELVRRRADGKAPAAPHRGVVRHREHVTQAHEACDFDCLQAAASTPELVIY